MALCRDRSASHPVIPAPSQVTEKAGGSDEPAQNTMLNRIATLGRTMRQGVGRTMMSIGKQYQAAPAVVDPKVKKAKEEAKKKEARWPLTRSCSCLPFR